VTATIDLTASAGRSPRPHGEVLARGEGVELIGEYEGSGFKQPPLLARRSDGQVVQLTRLLYLVATACDGRRDARGVADIVTQRCGRVVSAANVRFLVEKQLRPVGVLALADGTTPELPQRRALLALRHRRPIASEKAVNAAAAPLMCLHRPPIQALVLAAILVFDVWLFGLHGIAAGLRSALYEPAHLLGVMGSVVLATVLHELGHASACRYGGARPGVLGVGVYLVWPAFYCDVTDAYRLDRTGRLRTDLGGVYFNGIFVLLVAAAYFATGEEALLLAACVQHILVLQQLLPLLRFDGYYVLSDLTGVPDILSRIGPVLRSLIPGRRREPRVEELKPWVRVVVTAYLLVLVPALALLVTWIVVAAPRLVATAYDAVMLQLKLLGAGSEPAEIGLGALRIAALALPLGAMAMSLGRSGRLAIGGLARWADGSVARSVLALGAIAAIACFALSAWWPDGDYRPIRPGERGTVGEAVSGIPDAARSLPEAAGEGPRLSWTEAEEPAQDGSLPAGTPAQHRPDRLSVTPARDLPAGEQLTGHEDVSAWHDEPAGQEDEPTRDIVFAPAPVPVSGPVTITNEQTAAPPVSSPAPAPTATPAPGETLTPTPTPTATPEPAASPSPTETATPTPNDASGPTPTVSPTPTP
jgi:putative peptide zinc metalloprotease protein